MTATRPVRLRLSRAMRLQKTREFTQVRNQGQRMVRGCLIANWMPLPPGSSSRVGLITTRKLGKATVRARARRLLREAFRLHQHELQYPVALVLVARSSIIGKKRAGVESDFLWVLRQANLIRKVE